MSIESKLTGIEVYYSTNITFILETVISTMLFWGYNTTFTEDGSIKAIKDKTRPGYFLSQESIQEILTENKLEKINIQINQKQETIKDHILKMGLIYFFSLFEAFNKDYFQEIFVFKPVLMRSKEKTVDLEFLLQFNSLEDLHKSLSQSLIEKFGYFDIDKLADFILKKFKIDIQNNFDSWSTLRESYFRRNCVVHNDGKMSEIYLGKISLGIEHLNEDLICDIEYIWRCHKDIQSYMRFIDDSIRNKFKLKSFI